MNEMVRHLPAILAVLLGGLAVLIPATAVALRLGLKPLMGALGWGRGDPDESETVKRLERRVAALEEQNERLERQVAGLLEAREFDRQLTS